MASARWRLFRVTCAVGGLALACGGATRQGDEQTAAGAPISGAGTSTTAGASAGTPAGQGGAAAVGGGSASAGAPLEDPSNPWCFEPRKLPDDWYEDGAAGRGDRECPVAQDPTFGIGICYFVLKDPIPATTPPDQAGQCCYYLTTAHCR